MRILIALTLIFVSQNIYSAEPVVRWTITPEPLIKKMKHDNRLRPESFHLFHVEIELETYKYFSDNKMSWDPEIALKNLREKRKSLVDMLTESSDPFLIEKLESVDILIKALEKDAYKYPKPSYPQTKVQELIFDAKRRLSLERQNSLALYRKTVTLTKDFPEDQVAASLDSVIDANGDLIVYSFFTKEALVWPSDSPFPTKPSPSSPEFARAIDSFNREKAKLGAAH